MLARQEIEEQRIKNRARKTEIQSALFEYQDARDVYCYMQAALNKAPEHPALKLASIKAEQRYIQSTFSLSCCLGLDEESSQEQRIKACEGYLAVIASQLSLQS